MTDKRRQAFIAWAHSADLKVKPEDSPSNGPWATEIAWFAWQAACEWMAQPPQPTEGALVLDGEFFKRDNR